MKQSIRIGLGFILLLTVSNCARAQRTGGVHISSVPSVQHVSPTVTSTVTRFHGTATPMQSVASFHSSMRIPRVVALGSNGFPLSVRDLLDPVPGFGFDFSHLAAVTRDLDVRALIDPITQLRLAQAERLLRETPATSAVFPFFIPQTPAILLEQAPPVIIIQQPAPIVQTPPAPEDETRPAAAPVPPPAPVPDIGEFILILRDGSLISAVAFSRQGDRIIYITREGARRMLPLASLDGDATARANEERGTSLQLHL
jgi:hypothetical protein